MGQTPIFSRPPSKGLAICSCRRWSFSKFTSACSRKGKSVPRLSPVSVLQHGQLIELTASLAIAAARISQHENFPLADSIILATARARNATIWTQDSDFEEMDRVEYRAAKR